MIIHPEKVLFPDDGITKGELASYYEAVAPVMLPHIRRRSVTMERYHRGIGAPGFFQKDVSKGFPEWLKRVEVPKNDGTVNHPIVTDTRSLLWLANQNSITIHVWPSRTPNFYQPDICVFDLDPSGDAQRGELCKADFLLLFTIHHLRLLWIAAAAFSSTPVATTTAPRSPLLILFVPDQAPLFLRPAPVRRSNAERYRLEVSRSATWPNA